MAIEIREHDLKVEYDITHREVLFEQYKEERLLFLREKGEHIFFIPFYGETTKLDAINHFPELREYEIWMEGHEATGESSKAQLLDKIKARNFAQACHVYYCTNFVKNQEIYNNPNYKEYINAARWDYDGNKLAIWGCKLYWSEELVRRSFG